jgi:Protein of unknown function (DUF3300)
VNHPLVFRMLSGRLRGAACRALALLVSGVLSAGEGMLLAQEAAPQPQAAPTADEQAPKLSGDQLDALVAPIALYPDPLLAQCLVASTYPVEVIQAQQWLARNPNLKGDDLVKAAEQQDWDPSIQALASIPDALKVLAQDIKWTTDLGDAFLAQQSDVMDAVQRLRGKAKDSGKLTSSEQQKVETQVVEDKTIVVIQPASTEVVYVPTYSPSVIWGVGYYPYPPLYYPPYYGGAWLGFGVGIAIGIGISGGWGWGCGWHGGGNTININNNNNYVRNSNINRGQASAKGTSNWQHNAQHRGGAPYNNRATANQYGGTARGDSRPGGASASSRDFGRGGAGPSASTRDAGGGLGGSSGYSGGADRVGGRDISSGHSGSGFSGSSGGSRGANMSSSRGSSSFGGGGMRGGGGRGGGRR